MQRRGAAVILHPLTGGRILGPGHWVELLGTAISEGWVTSPGAGGRQGYAASAPPPYQEKDW